MTCIVALVKDGEVYMGGDSAGVAGYRLTTRKDEKVFTNGDFVFGFTTSFRMGQLLRYAFKPPMHHPDTVLMEYMVTDFIDAIRRCFSDGGYQRKKDGEEMGGTFLIGYQGRLFKIDSDFQVGEAIHAFDACGCGEDIALGVLYSLHYCYGDPGLGPETALGFALEAAEAHSAGVRGPFHFASTIDNKKKKDNVDEKSLFPSPS